MVGLGRNSTALILVFLLFLILSASMAYPDIRTIATNTPQDYADGHFYQWNLFWVIHAMQDDRVSVTDPNIFWPKKGTLAYSDPLIGPAAITWIMNEIFGYPASFGLTYFVAWIVSMWAMFLLAKWLTSNVPASIIASIVFNFAAPRLVQYLHFQLVIGGAVLPLAFLFLFKLLEKKRVSIGIPLGMTIAFVFLTALYYAAFLAIALPVALVSWLIFGGRLSRRSVAGLGLAAIIGVGAFLPILPAYLSLQDPYFDRNQEYDADLRDFLAPTGHSVLYRALDARAESKGQGIENRLFPGALAVVLGTAGSYIFIRKRTGLSTERRRALGALMLAGGASFVLAFGREIWILGVKVPGPYRLVAEIPGFGSIRSTSRFIIITMIALSALVALAVARLIQNRKPLGTTLIVAILLLVMCSEYAARLHKVPAVTDPAMTEANRALSRMPSGAVVELPMGNPENRWWGYIEAPRMVLSRLDWHPRVNGYSGFHPPGYTDVVNTLNSLGITPSQEEGINAAEMLRLLEVRYVLIRTYPLALFSPEDPNASLAAWSLGQASMVEQNLGDLVIAREDFRHGVLIELQFSR